jgi:hypothetical protein
MLRHVALVRTDALEECSTSIIRETRIGEPGATFLSKTSVLTRATRRTSQKKAFFTVTAMKTPNLTLEKKNLSASIYN